MGSVRRQFTRADTLWFWRHRVLRSDLPAATRLVLLTLACHMRDGSDNCFSSVKGLTAETGLAPEAVKAALVEAVIAGMIEVRQVEARHLYVTRL